MRPLSHSMLGLLTAIAFTGCAANAPMPHVDHLDLQRYMGAWYVIAAIPSYPERHAYNAVESYALLPDGKIQTTFRFRQGSFDGPLRTMHPVGTVRPGTGQAVWGMQFVWPIKAEYVVAYVNADYGNVIVARSKRDYVWIMARTPGLPEAVYQQLTARVAALGYDTHKLRKVPQQWPEPGP
ncbi:lipocalin family protein [Dyella jejuensis]|uniref:Outer membrane lipoprotein Blc n=1 Tax=Dyella jejuensis TaxID=1432009 RepID=A0ABW8JNF9_9GAMM